MKSILLFIPVLLILISCDSASIKVSEEEPKPKKWQDKEELSAIFEKDLSDMMTLFNSGEFEEAVDYMPEMMFRHVPKEQLIAEFKLMNRMGMEFEILSYKVVEISDPVLHEGDYYCRVLANVETKILFDDTMPMSKEVLKEAYDSTEYQFKEIADHYFTVESQDENYAIVQEDSDQWGYIRFDSKLKEYLANIVPVQVRTRFK